MSVNTANSNIDLSLIVEPFFIQMGISIDNLAATVVYDEYSNVISTVDLGGVTGFSVLDGMISFSVANGLNATGYALSNEGDVFEGSITTNDLGQATFSCNFNANISVGNLLSTLFGSEFSDNEVIVSGQVEFQVENIVDIITQSYQFVDEIDISNANIFDPASLTIDSSLLTSTNDLSIESLISMLNINSVSGSILTESGHTVSVIYDEILGIKNLVNGVEVELVDVYSILSYLTASEGEIVMNNNNYPDGFIPPVDGTMVTQALETYVNQSTAEIYTVPSGGWTIPEGWLRDDSINGAPVVVGDIFEGEVTEDADTTPDTTDSTNTWGVVRVEDTDNDYVSFSLDDGAMYRETNYGTIYLHQIAYAQLADDQAMPIYYIPQINLTGTFDMYDASGGYVGGANQVTGSLIAGSVIDSAGFTDDGTMQISSDEPFFGSLWIAHDVSYDFNAEDNTMSVDMMFDWGVTQNIGVEMTASVTFNDDGTATITATDGDGDGIFGNAMLEGPFSGLSPVFNFELSSEDGLAITPESFTSDLYIWPPYPVIDFIDWSYQLNNDYDSVQTLNALDSVLENFTIVATDEHGATASQEITVTIHGTDEEGGNIENFDFSGVFAMHDPFGQWIGGSDDLIGSMSIDMVTGFGVGTMSSNTPFYGQLWAVNNINIQMTGNTMHADMVFEWSNNTIETDIDFDVNFNDDGSISLTTIDGDGDGVLGNAMTSGPFVGFNMVIQEGLAYPEGYQPPTPGNTVPAAVGEIADMIYEVGDTKTLDNIAQYFIDADGDTLTYTVQVNDGAVMTLDHWLSTPIPDGSEGVHAIQVTASDGQSTATQLFSVTVNAASPSAAQLIQIRNSGAITKAQVSVDEYGEDYTSGNTDKLMKFELWLNATELSSFGTTATEIRGYQFDINWNETEVGALNFSTISGTNVGFNYANPDNATITFNSDLGEAAFANATAIVDTDATNDGPPLFVGTEQLIGTFYMNPNADLEVMSLSIDDMMIVTDTDNINPANYTTALEISSADATIQTESTNYLSNISLSYFKDGIDTGVHTWVENGEIIFPDVSLDFDSVKLSDPTSYINEIMSDDAVDVLREIVHLDSLTTGSAAWHSADVDNDGVITADDAVGILRHIVHLDEINTFDLIDNTTGNRITNLDANAIDMGQWSIVANGDVDQGGGFVDGYTVAMDVI